jgi:hypothetical protein
MSIMLLDVSYNILAKLLENHIGGLWNCKTNKLINYGRISSLIILLLPGRELSGPKERSQEALFLEIYFDKVCDKLSATLLNIC